MSQKSIFRIFLRNIIILIIVLTVFNLTIQKIYNDHIRESLSQAYIADLVFRAEEEFKNFYKPIESILIISQKWGESGILEFDNIETMNARFIPILDLMNQIHAVKITGDNREFYSLTRGNNLWLTHLIKKRNHSLNFLEQQWSQDGNLIKEQWLKTDYDVLDRPWYIGARDITKPNTVFWTPLRTILSAQSQGITASIRWIEKNKPDNIFVLAYDILFNQIFRAVSNLRVSKNSQVFLYRDNDNKIFRLATSDSISEIKIDSSGNFIDHRITDTPLISRSISEWQSSGMPDEDPINFYSGRASYWTGLRPIDREHINLWIGVIVPENDFLAQLERRQQTNYLLSLLVLAFGVVIALFIVRKYRKQLGSGTKVLINENNIENSVRKLIIGGETKTVEFKSTLRMNLRTGESGKEIEMAWLKGATAFMNSEGGILLFGINDDGETTGLEADKFENEDKCRLHFKNLINQHIGAEFTIFLNFRIISLDGKSIAVLECAPSSKPVFLKNKSEEFFYIRSGPSSIKLQTSKVLEYLESRKS